MTKESLDQLRAYQMILLALDDVVRGGGQPRFEGDDAATNTDSFKELVKQYAGNRVSEEAIDEALKVPLKDIASILLEKHKQS